MGRRPASEETPTAFTVITGLSGAGRSAAADFLEDRGYFVVDNLPPALIEKMADLASGKTKVDQVALVVDVRSREFFDEFAKSMSQLRERGHPTRIIFMEASDEILVRRYESTRRRHPLAESGSIAEGIRREREMLASIRESADLIIDTTETDPPGLVEKLRSMLGPAGPSSGLSANVTSFGYKHGVPRDSDLVLDVRFLPNPYWVPDLKALDGRSDEVRDYVLNSDGANDFLAKTKDLLAFLVPRYGASGKKYLILAIGCTGGRHRSPVIAEAITEMVREIGVPTTLVHRDIEHE